MKEKRKLKVLILEDVDSDAELIIMHLRDSEFNCNFQRARNRKEYIRYFKSFEPDIILSDFNLADYDGIKALKYKKKNSPHCPFVLITGSLGEEKAVETILLGASDFLLKDNLHNLEAAIIRSLRISSEQKARLDTVDQLRKSELYFRSLIENNHDPILTFNESNKITYASPAVKIILGYTTEEIVGSSIVKLLHPDDKSDYQKKLKNLLDGKLKDFCQIIRVQEKNRNYRWMQAIITDERYVEGVGSLVTNLRDIHEYIVTNDQLREKNILIDSVIKNLSEGVIVADNERNFILFNKAAERILGVDLYSLDFNNWITGVGTYKSDRITKFKPEELPIVRAMNGESITDVEMFIEHPRSNGGTYLSINAQPLKDNNAKVCGGVISFRNVTENKNMQFKLERTLADLERNVEERTAELQHTHQELKEVHQHLLYSINYAKKIQQAIVPSEKEITKRFGSAFTIYLPRDVVSGDFIWMHEGPGLYLAVADCTGHGVPGAMLTMLGNELLDRIVVDKNIYKPHLVLEELHTGITKLLKKTDKTRHMNDGMDISLCHFNIENRSLQFSGAMNDGLLVKKNGELITLEANKRSVGGGITAVERFGKFETIEVDYLPGDRLYLFTDGLQDQFGGPNAKKFMKKRLKELIIEVQNFPMENQEEIILYKFQEWKRKHSQIDDVTLVGIQL